jgi:capsular exopolysaccharide synthesis family protein
MSRIDEALRRVAGEPLAPVSPVEFERSTGRSTEETLSRYPMEAPTDRRGGRADLAPGVLIAPGARQRKQFGGIDPEIDEKIVTGHPTGIAIEQYRRLAAALHEAQAARNVRTVMITSAVPREGKTLTAANLALTLSESYGLRVLLIDADLRRPSVHGIFRLPNSTGLSEGLRVDKGQLPLIEVSPTLTVLPAGRPDTDPMAGLTSDRMKAVIAEAIQRFDWVILDTPPVGLMPDAQLLARLVDGVVVVIGANATPYTLVQRVVAEIGADKIIGTVLNRVEESTIPATGYYGHYYVKSK